MGCPRNDLRQKMQKVRASLDESSLDARFCGVARAVSSGCSKSVAASRAVHWLASAT
jgi:hypothetical protein